MHQPDEKAQLNLFLGEWLSHCLPAATNWQAFADMHPDQTRLYMCCN